MKVDGFMVAGGSKRGWTTWTTAAVLEGLYGKGKWCGEGYVAGKDAEADKNFFWRIQRYQSIQDTQARALRKRFLISGYTQGTINGAYFGVASSPTHYPAARDPGYSKAFAMDVIRNIRTDLDAFSEVEQAVLMNHGYALADAAVLPNAYANTTANATETRTVRMGLNAGAVRAVEIEAIAAA